ncbi:MAG TPA: toxin TcdB middle/N-terminal domain-containing protein [Polyangiaceae bacterium]|nr:toxin TcdB middle/N-terminal domain-containing protein [Polyangiaceae bacterium]
MVDLLRVDDGNVLVKLNDGRNGFKPEQSWGSLSADDILNTRADRTSQAAARVHLVDPLIRWVAPYTGTVDVSGSVQRLAVGGKDGVRVQLIHNNSIAWTRDIASNDTSACAPGAGNSCAGDLSLPVSAGDRVYVKVSAIDDTKSDVVVFSPTFTYRKSAAELALLEPYGRPMYRFNQSDDFRVAGMPTPRWVASANGTVHLFGNLTKLTTSDDVRVRIVRTRSGVETDLLLPVPTLSGGSTNSVPVDMSIPVQAGDDIRFQIQSDVQVDPARVVWSPQVEYTEYCRISPATSAEVCGAVSCYTDPDGRRLCNIANDPVPDIPIPEEIIKQSAFVGFDTFEWAPRTETATVAASGNTLSFSGTLNKPSGSEATVLIQAVNRLIHKEVIAAGSTSASIAATGSATPGEQLFVTVLTDSASIGSVSLSATVNGASVPVNIRFPHPSFGIDPFTHLPVDGMAGGFHHWYFGDWNGNAAFNEAEIHYVDPSLGPSNFMFAAPVYFDIAPGTRVPAWVGRGDGAYIAAGQINPARLGSLIPGLSASGTLKALRLADTWNFTLTGKVGPATGSVSLGDTVTELDLVDLNGDRYPDSVYGDGVRYNTRGGFGGKESSNLGFGDVRRVEHRNISFKAGYTKELINKTDSKGQTKALVQTGFSVGVDYGLSGTHVDLADINGDGLVDHVSQDPDSGSLKVRLNLGYGFTDEISWGSQEWDTESVSPGTGIGGGIQSFLGDVITATYGKAVRSDVVRLQDSANNSVGAGIDVGGVVGGGGGVTFGISRTYVDLIDLTGDGLPEHVFRDANSEDLYVKLNLGDRFSPPVKWHIPTWNVNVDPSDWAVLGQADALTFSRNISYSGSFGFKVCFILCVGVSGFWSENRTDSSMAFDDVDGDGNVDQVLKQADDATVRVKKNRLQKTNLLRKVTRPLGGEFELDYTRQGNLVDRSDATAVVDMPNNQWALTSVVTKDGAGNTYARGHQYHQSGYFDRAERESYGFARVTTTREDGSTIETAFHNQDYYRKGLPKETYERDASGQLYTAEVVSYREPGTLPQFTGTFFPGEKERRSRFYEGQTSSPLAFGKETHETRTYDVDLGEQELGNLRFYQIYGEEGATDDDVAYEISYDIRSNGVVRPARIVGRDASGNVLRERQSSYGTKGEMTSLTNVVTGGRNAAGAPYTGAPATYSFTYDSAGNLATVTGPNGYTTTYGYDPQSLTYKTTASDSFGYTSRSTPNYYFGAVGSVTDTNEQQVQYDYDDFGRLIRVWGPTDLGSIQPSLVFEYQLQPGYTPPGGGVYQPVWARTLHKDVTAPDGDPLVTITFVDGLDRVIQTKKDLERDIGTGTVVGMSVSGRVEFDARGRLRRQSQPVFQTTSIASHLPGSDALTYFDPGVVRPTQFDYDVLGRTLAVQTPDGNQTNTSYGFADLDGRRWFVTTLTDPNGRHRTSYTDVGERVGAVQEFNTLGAGGLLTLTTRYAYNPMDELVQVTDARGNGTTAQYDTVGRMVALTSPDTGRTEWSYDLAGNLVAKETARLRAAGQKVVYEYDYNRLTRIDYPGTQTDVSYEYGDPIEAGSAAGNLAGRVKREINEAGWRRFYYDELGNIATRESSFERMREPHLGPYQETVSYKYDPFGRVLQIRFPGSNHEVVAYGYDKGGLVRSAFGLNTTINAQHPDESPLTIYFEHIGYDEFEQRVRTIHGNGLETSYSYDPNTRRLTEINADHRDPVLRQQAKPARPFQRLRYGYDAVGNILQANNIAPYDEQMNASVLVGTVNQAFTYDDLYQLKTATGLYQNRHDWRWGYTYSQSYDEIGNITQKVQDSYREKYENGGYVFDHNEILQSFRNEYEYNSGRPHAPSRVNEFVPPETQARVIALTYDASGNQTNRLYRNSEPRTITWDADDRVKVVNLNGQDMSIMRYDGSGERAVHFHHVSGLEETAYMDQHLTIRDGRYHTKHIYAGETRMASKMDPDWFQYPPTLYYHPDHLGSTNFVSNDDQTLTQHDEYFPSGERWWDETDSRYELYKSYIFSGKELDQAIGLYYYGARYYDARQGQWISPDPILSKYLGGSGNGGAFNPINLSVYTQSYNNPIRYRDPNGQIPIDTLWDAANVVYDIGKIGVGYATGNTAMMVDGSKDLAMDTGALLIPYVPAGASKLLKVGIKYGDEAADSLKAFDKANDARKAAEAAAETKKAADAAEAAKKASDAKKAAEAAEQAKAATAGPKVGSSGGPGAGKRFSKKTQDAAEKQADSKCVFCGRETTRKPGPTQRNTDHAQPKSRGGNNTVDNAQNTCRDCNLDKRARTTEEYLRDKR